MINVDPRSIIDKITYGEGNLASIVYRYESHPFMESIHIRLQGLFIAQ